MIKHATASTFIFCRFDRRWKLGLVLHPRLERHMICGGHVEADESHAEAAMREVLEESGLRIRLVLRPAPPVPLPADHPLGSIVEPWWTTYAQVPPDNHLAEPHVHIDYQFVAFADSPDPVSEPEHPFAWYAPSELAGLNMFDDTRQLARELFASIDMWQHQPTSGEALVGGATLPLSGASQ